MGIPSWWVDVKTIVNPSATYWQYVPKMCVPFIELECLQQSHSFRNGHCMRWRMVTEPSTYAFGLLLWQLAQVWLVPAPLFVSHDGETPCCTPRALVSGVCTPITGNAGGLNGPLPGSGLACRLHDRCMPCVFMFPFPPAMDLSVVASLVYSPGQVCSCVRLDVMCSPGNALRVVCVCAAGQCHNK